MRDNIFGGMQSLACVLSENKKDDANESRSEMHSLKKTVRAERVARQCPNYFLQVLERVGFIFSAFYLWDLTSYTYLCMSHFDIYCVAGVTITSTAPLPVP